MPPRTKTHLMFVNSHADLEAAIRDVETSMRKQLLHAEAITTTDVIIASMNVFDREYRAGRITLAEIDRLSGYHQAGDDTTTLSIRVGDRVHGRATSLIRTIHSDLKEAEMKIQAPPKIGKGYNSRLIITMSLIYVQQHMQDLLINWAHKVTEAT